MNIDIIIKDVNVELAKRIFKLVEEEDKKVTVHEKNGKSSKRFPCSDCGKTYASQNSLNAHGKHCKKTAKAETTEVVAPKKEKRGRDVAPPEKKPVKKEPKFRAPTENDLKKVVAAAVIANGNNITSSESIWHDLKSNLRKVQGASKALDSYLKGLEPTIASHLRTLEKHLGAGQCMGMDVDTGYQVAIFADLEKLTLANLLKAL